MDTAFIVTQAKVIKADKLMLYVKISLKNWRPASNVKSGL